MANDWDVAGESPTDTWGVKSEDPWGEAPEAAATELGSITQMPKEFIRGAGSMVADAPAGVVAGVNAASQLAGSDMRAPAWAESGAKAWKSGVDKLLPEAPVNPTYAQMAGNMAGAVTAGGLMPGGVLAKGLPFALQGMAEAQDAADKSGASPTDRSKYVAGSGVLGELAGFVPAAGKAGDAFGRQLWNSAKTGLAVNPAITVGGNVLQQQTINPNQPTLAGAGESAVTGLVGGPLGHAASEGVKRAAGALRTNPDTLSKPAQDVEQEAKAAAASEMWQQKPLPGKPYSGQLLDFVKQTEESGKAKLTPYNDGTGTLTIGYGHTGKGVTKDTKITQEQAESLLHQDLGQAANDVANLVTVPLTQGQRDALISFQFNTGALGKSTTLKRLNKGDYAGAAEAMELYNKATINGKRVELRGLTDRRAAERAMFEGQGIEQSSAGSEPSQQNDSTVTTDYTPTPDDLAFRSLLMDNQQSVVTPPSKPIAEAAQQGVQEANENAGITAPAAKAPSIDTSQGATANSTQERQQPQNDLSQHPGIGDGLPGVGQDRNQQASVTPQGTEASRSNSTQKSTRETLGTSTSPHPNMGANPSLFRFLAAHGGIQDQGGDLAAMDLHTKNIPGVGKLVRPDGMPLDQAREMAELAGYIKPTDRAEEFGRTELPDLLAALRTESFGKKVFRDGITPDRIAKQKDKDAFNDDAERYMDDVADRWEGATQNLADIEKAEVKAMVDRGVDLDDAVHDVIERNALKYPPKVVDHSEFPDDHSEFSDDHFNPIAKDGNANKGTLLDNEPPFSLRDEQGQPLTDKQTGKPLTRDVAEQRLNEALGAALKHWGLDDRTSARVAASVKGGKANGRVLSDKGRRLVELAINYGEENAGSDVGRTAFHEAMHILSDPEMGLLKPGEVALLRQGADAWLAGKHESGRTNSGYLADKYKDVIATAEAKAKAEGRSPAAERNRIMKDEALSHWAEEVYNKRKFPPQKTRDLLARIKSFMDAIRNGINGMGFRTAEGFMHAIEGGQLKGRGVVGDRRPGETKEQYALRVYHGTPHDFDRFDISKIGTGEGAQVYGHGLYFAGKKQTAEWYRDRLSNDMISYKGKSMEDFEFDGDDHAIAMVGERMANIVSDPKVAISKVRNELREQLADVKNELESGIDGYGDPILAERIPLYNNEIKTIERNIKIADILSPDDFRFDKQGKLYHVDIPDEGEYLLWDKPLSEQPDKIRDAINDVVRQNSVTGKVRPSFTGKALYHLVEQNQGQNAEAASDALREAGIRGIKYLDGNSRNGSGDSHNYVLFNDKDATIAEKYSLRDTADKLKGIAKAAANSQPAKELRDTAWWKDITKASDKFFSDLQMQVAPMAVTGERGSDNARKIAKTFANEIALVQHRFGQIDTIIRNRFDPKTRAAMGTALDNESAHEKLLREDLKAMDGAKATPQKIAAFEAETRRQWKAANKGIDSLNPEQRYYVDLLSKAAEVTWQRLKDAGIINPNAQAIPYYMPRMLVRMMKDGTFEKASKGEGGPMPMDRIGSNLRTAGPKNRKYRTADETLAAAKKAMGDDVELVTDIRALGLALSKNEQSIAGRNLVNEIKKLGSKLGYDTATTTPRESSQYFSIDHPSLKQWEPTLEKNDDGKWRQKLDENGEPIFHQAPIHIAREFEGPLRAVLTKPNGEVYKALMAIKGASLSMIMASPIIHLGVEYGRALPLMPGKMVTLKVYKDGQKWRYGVTAFVEGGKLRESNDYMAQAIRDGVRPISSDSELHRDITGIAETAQLGEMSPLQKAKHAWHEFHRVALWDRIADLQMGIYANSLEHYQAKGFSRSDSGKIAAHEANRYAGALPKEAMGALATKLANLAMFSRTFTLGNLGVFKDALTGAPRDVLASLDQAKRGDAAKAMSAHAWQAVLLDIGMFITIGTALQTGVAALMNDPSLSDDLDFMGRLHRELQHLKDHPLDIINLIGVAGSISPTHDNEPGRTNKAYIGRTQDGTALYARTSLGKFGEEIEGWMTDPLGMAKRKGSPMMKSAIGVWSNADDFGKRIYKPDDPSMDGKIKALGNIAAYVFNQNVPVDYYWGIHDAVMGGPNSQLSLAKTVMPLLTGISIQKGFPGGPTAGVLFRENQNHNEMVQEAKQTAKHQFMTGQDDAAVKTLQDAGVTGSAIGKLQDSVLNPHPTRANQSKFNRNAPEDIKDFAREHLIGRD